VALRDVRLLIPVMPTTFYCVGYNYAEHANEFNTKARKIPTRPDVGYRAQSALIAHDETIFIPAASTGGTVQYEGELVVVIGKQAKHLNEADAFDCVFGYTIGNDVSERTWQRGDRTFWRGKNTDTFKPMGPWIETDVNLDAMDTVVRVNGKEDLRFKTNDMIFGIAHYIAAMTKYMTLYPGDVIWMGTDGTSPDLVHGDVVEVELTGLGVLRNRFVRAGQ
jgi:2-keto-4-pentenoate hydratase/2-oxohepta-3-ene-1,7-dioic acid hydratase in catechol pathway